MSRKNYPTDLTDEEWSRIEELFQVSYVKGGRPLKHSKREILDAIFMYYVLGVSGDICRTTFQFGRQYEICPLAMVLFLLLFCTLETLVFISFPPIILIDILEIILT